MTVRGGLFQSNQAYFYGGGIHTGVGVTLEVADTRFLSNTANFAGGGFQADGPTTVVGGLFEGNQCLSPFGCYGGAVDGRIALAVTGTEFINNSGAYAGGIYLGNTSRIVNALFAGNLAYQEGSALYLGSSFEASAYTATVLHSTITGPCCGKAAIVIGHGALGITDSIIANYPIGISLTGGSAFENYNLFFSVPVTTAGGVVHGGHSLTGDPAFRNPAADDYHLTADSAAINAGINAGVTTDFDGDPRPSAGGFDIGFDEYWLKLYLPLVQRQ